jgi:hypothetical protein
MDIFRFSPALAGEMWRREGVSSSQVGTILPFASPERRSFFSSPLRRIDTSVVVDDDD